MLKAYQESPEGIAAIYAPPGADSENPPLPELPVRDGDRAGVETVRLDRQLGPKQQDQARLVLRQRQDMFSTKPAYTTMAVHRVETLEQPPIRQAAYQVPESVREGMRQEIKDMLDLGVIEPSNSPWASPVVLVPKRDGTTHFCIDYRQLNDCTTTDAYPMPRVDELLDRIARGNFPTNLDLCKGYWQIPLDLESVPKSAFITPFDLYQSKIMPFGMKNAPATFQRMVDQHLDAFQDYACAYLDDIAIYS